MENVIASLQIICSPLKGRLLLMASGAETEHSGILPKTICSAAAREARLSFGPQGEYFREHCFGAF